MADVATTEVAGEAKVVKGWQRPGDDPAPRTTAPSGHLDEQGLPPPMPFGLVGEIADAVRVGLRFGGVTAMLAPRAFAVGSKLLAK
mmetsp:Transcript_71893/g.156612  ORF Transcript_71893/g.156612 Transcript_71893/m.156612 type:complete len:86 (+) Transcript_71893:1178-1435(+)